ncbi:MAG: helix-turn-helix transcriptional regulator [Candidatus Thiodiazotropha sp.]
MTINNTGDILRFYRRLSDLSQLELAAFIGKSQGWVYQVERGFLRPSPDDRERLFHALNIDPSVLDNLDD